VGGDFRCHDNKLTSLKGAPQEVGGRFNCHRNKLTSLVGAPQEVGGDFYCYENSLTSLEGAPQEVGGSFNCRHNKLASLVGAPQEVGEDFFCRDNKLTSLEGLAEAKIGGTFIMDDLLSISWNLEGWLTGLKKNPRLFGPLIDKRINDLEFLFKNPKIINLAYPHINGENKTIFVQNLYTMFRENPKTFVDLNLSPQIFDEINKFAATQGADQSANKTLSNLSDLTSGGIFDD
jgi:hypothetical protein